LVLARKASISARKVWAIGSINRIIPIFMQ
jgi:hypothetical protein